MKKKIIIITSIILTILAVAASSVYALWYISANRKIDPADITPNLVKAYIEAETREYNGKYQIPLSDKLDNSKLTYTYNGTTIYQNGSYVNQSSSPIDADTYVIQVSYETGESQAEPIDILFTINEKVLKASSVELTSELVYNGSSQTPMFNTSKIGIEVRDTNYINVSVDASGEYINAGTYEASVKLENSTTEDRVKNYTIKGTASFTIAKRPIAIAWSGTSNDDGTTLVYSGVEKEITCNMTGVYSSDGSLIDNTGPLNDVNCSIEYYRDGANTTNTSKCNYAGQYTLNAIIDNENYEIVSGATTLFNVNKATLSLDNVTFEYDYSSDTRTWSGLKAQLGTSLANVTLNGVCDVHQGKIILVFSSMTDGTFSYYYNATANNTNNPYDSKNTYMGFTKTYLTTYVVGSTYKLTFSLDYSNVEDDNLTLVKASYTENINEAEILCKYKTAKIESTYYTIEDAINAGFGTISLAGEASNTTYVATSFSKILNSTSYLLSNRTLIAPYADNINPVDYNGSASNATGAVFSLLFIPMGLTLTLNNSATLTAAGYINNSGQDMTITANRGVIYNNGNIILNSSYLNAYGYIKGSGIITLNNSTAVDCLRVFDWMGGSNAMSLPDGLFGGFLYNKVLITNAWSMHNNACTTIINAGSKYDANVKTIVSSAVIQATARVLGSSRDNNCIFKINSGKLTKSVSYAVEWESNSSSYSSQLQQFYLVIGSNQQKGQRDKFVLEADYVEGVNNFEDSTLEISVGATISTSTSKPATIGFLDINIKSGTLALKNSDYAFLPGSHLEIGENAKVTIGSSVDVTIFKDFATYSDETLQSYNTSYASPSVLNNSNTYSYYSHCIDKNDAQFVVNGTLEVYGSIGGEIQTNTAGAVLDLSSANLEASYALMNNPGSVSYTSGRLIAIANVDGTKINSLNKTTYISEGTYWHEVDPSSIHTYTVNFHYIDDDGVDQVQTITKKITATEYDVTGNEFNPDSARTYYSFTNWYTDYNCTTLFEGTTLTSSNSSIDLYAGWEATEYKISYSPYLVDDDGNLSQITSGVSITNPDSYVNSGAINSLQCSIFTVESFVDGVLQLPTASYESYNFDGWYVGVNDEYKDTTARTSLSFSAFEQIIAQYGEGIPLYCEFSNVVTYTLEFKVNNENITDVSLDNYTTQNSTIILPDSYFTWSNNYDSNVAYGKYFGGTNGTWYYLDSNGNQNNVNTNTILNLNEIAQDSNSTTITLYAKWVDKYKVEYNFGDIRGSIIEYYMPNTTVTLYTFEYTANTDIYGNMSNGSNTKLTTYYNGSNYYTINGTYNNGTYKFGDTKTLESNTTFTMDYEAVSYYEVTIIKLSRSLGWGKYNLKRETIGTIKVKSGCTIDISSLIINGSGYYCEDSYNHNDALVGGSLTLSGSTKITVTASGKEIYCL